MSSVPGGHGGRAQTLLQRGRVREHLVADAMEPATLRMLAVATGGAPAARNHTQPSRRDAVIAGRVHDKVAAAVVAALEVVRVVVSIQPIEAFGRQVDETPLLATQRALNDRDRALAAIHTYSFVVVTPPAIRRGHLG